VVCTLPTAYSTVSLGVREERGSRCELTLGQRVPSPYILSLPFPATTGQMRLAFQVDYHTTMLCLRPRINTEYELNTM
jgi:hypothetical protein